MIMIDAAVAIEAFDGETPQTEDMIHHEWINPSVGRYEERLWASEWHQLFSPGNGFPNDKRNTLTWRDRLSKLGNTVVYNFYSSGEEVLATHNGATPTIIGEAGGELYNVVFGSNPMGLSVWALQEKLKGRTATGEILGSTYGGWGFNFMWQTSPGIFMTPGQAALLTDVQIRENPFFRRGFEVPGATGFDPQLFGVNGSEYAEQNGNMLLAEAFPARTLPAGANPVNRFTPLGEQNHNFNMNEANFRNGWSAERPSPARWFHSDSRNMAYLYTHRLYTTIAHPDIGGLK
jgi:hypothetical protein